MVAYAIIMVIYGSLRYMAIYGSLRYMAIYGSLCCRANMVAYATWLIYAW